MRAPLDQRAAIKFLSDFGWRVGRPGNHAVKMVKPHHRPITLPRHHGGTYSKSLTYRIVKQAGVEPKEYEAWRSRSSYIRNGTVSGRRSRSFPDASRQAEL